MDFVDSPFVFNYVIFNIPENMGIHSNPVVWGRHLKWQGS
jgi:hypothetical protein